MKIRASLVVQELSVKIRASPVVGSTGAVSEDRASPVVGSTGAVSEDQGLSCCTGAVSEDQGLSCCWKHRSCQ